MSEGEVTPSSRVSPPSASGADPESPWLGLASFTEETRPYFFGREAELKELYERIVHKPLTVLFGQSGLGKTSLLQAALVPRLREAGYLPVLVRLEHTLNSPPLERQVIAALYSAMYGAGTGILPDAVEADGSRLWLLLHDPQFGFAGTNDPQPDGNPRVRPIFLFDQFEEIFTLGDRPERRQDSLAFRDALACVIENRAPESVRLRLETDDDLADRLDFAARPAKVLLTLREDFLHVLERWRRQIPSLTDNRFELRLLNGPQALQAVVEPGKLRGPERPPIVSEETGAAIVRFVARVQADVPLDEIDAVPPLLSLICSELNARRFGPDGKPGEETVRSDQLQGRSEDILNNFYSNSFRDVPLAVRELVEDRLLSADGFRESLALDSVYRILQTGGLSAEAARGAVDGLVDRRLLVVEERGGVRRVELTHDILTGVARQSRDLRREQEAAERLRQQQEFDRSKAALDAEAAAQQRRYRRIRALSAGFAFLAALSIGAMLWALSSSREAQEARERAQKERAKAISQRTAAERAKADVEKAEDSLKKQIRQASVADLVAAIDHAGKGESRAAVAYLGRALKYDPSNQPAATWLWSALVYGHGDLDRLPCLVLKHDSAVRSIAYSPDGKRIVTGCGNEDGKDCYAQQWDAGTGKVIGQRMYEKTPVFSVCYSPNGERILTTNVDGAQMWDANTCTELGKAMSHDGEKIYSAALSPDAKQVLTAGEDGTARLWEADTANLIFKFIPAAKVSPQATEASHADDRTPKGRHHLAGHVASSSSPKTSEGAAKQAAGDQTVSAGPVICASFSPDGTRVLIGSQNGAAQQWDLKTKEAVGGPMQLDAELKGAVYSSDGARILTIDTNNDARIWSAKDSKPIQVKNKDMEPIHIAGFQVEGNKPLLPRSSPDGTRFLISTPGRTQQYDGTSLEDIGHSLYEDSAFEDTFYSCDGTRFVTVAEDGGVHLYDAHTGAAIGQPMRHEGSVLGGAFSPDGMFIATASSDKTARIWTASAGRADGVPLRHGNVVRSAVYNHDDTRILTAGWDRTARQWRATTVRQWDAATGKPIGPVLQLPAEAWDAAYSRDGHRIVTACDDGTAQQWDAATGEQVGPPLHHKDRVYSASYSPDGNRIVTGSADGTAQQWDARTGTPYGKPLHHGYVYSAVYNPEGTSIVTGNSDNSAQQWDAATCKPVGEPLSHDGGVQSVRFSRSGQRILTSCGNSSVAYAQEWMLPPPLPVPPAWLEAFVQVASGYRFGADGYLQDVSTDERLQAKARLSKELQNSVPSQDSWESLATWFLAPVEKRPLTPDSSITVPTLVENELASGFESGIRNAIDLAPAHPLAHLQLAGVENNPEAADFLRQYDLRHLPADAATHLHAASLLYDQNQDTEALKYAQQIVATDSNNPVALRIIAESLSLGLGRGAEALPVYVCLLALPEATAEDYARAAELYVKQNQLSRGQELFRQALAKYPDDPVVPRLQGWASLDLGSPKEALVFFQRSESLSQAANKPPWAGLYSGLAIARWRTADKDGAIKAYQQAIAGNNSYADGKWVNSSLFTEPERETLLPVLAETLRQHPDLAPKPSPAP